ncbi:MAG: hypothetical protein H6673_09565 [Anaerolineales bacterium]|nr:hypothetical protein [Anaerolineales bacterium]
MSEQPAPKKSKRPIVPVWVAVAGLVLTIVLAVLIVFQIAAPLAELVLGRSADIPLPDGAKLESEKSEAGRAQHEWLYSLANSDGCAVAEFFHEQGASCVYTPLACELAPEVGVLRQIATCAKTEKQLIDGYTWEVLISTEYHEDETSTVYFRVYLYD